MFRAFCSEDKRMDRTAFSIAASVVGLNRIVSKSKYEAIEASAFSTKSLSPRDASFSHTTQKPTSSLCLKDFVEICAEHMDRGGKVRSVRA